MHFALSPDQLTRITEGATATTVRAGVFRIEGPGAVDCLQGLLTNDVAGPGPRSLVYGALLTPKGMIVVDGWVMRLEDRLFFLCDESGRLRAAEVFRRSLPPRLARVADLSDEWSVTWMIGKESGAVLEASGIGTLPAAGRVTQLQAGAWLASGKASAPFEGLILADPATTAEIRPRILAGGASEGTATMVGAAMVLAGWPALGREIEERTLPQEVRFDELDGVSYSKGCYTGQETVARVHFRGHVNRVLRGVVFEAEEPLADVQLTSNGKEIGIVHSSTSVRGQVLGLALIRREISEGDEVTAGSRKGRVVELPFPASVVSHV